MGSVHTFHSRFTTRVEVAQGGKPSLECSFVDTWYLVFCLEAPATCLLLPASAWRVLLHPHARHARDTRITMAEYADKVCGL